MNSTFAQDFTPNYDETTIPDYTLPDPLVTERGEKVTTADQWTARRAELVRLFEEQIYGRIPRAAMHAKVEIKIVEESDDALNGKARRMQFVVTPLKEGKPIIRIGVLAYLPKTDGPMPCFLGLNFRGNHTVHADPDIILNTNWMRKGEGIVDNRATEASRGTSSSRWAVEEVVGRGYGLLTAYYGDIDPDFDDFSNGPHPAFYTDGATKPAADEWGSIAAWAWGLSKIREGIAKHQALSNQIDAERIAVLGHSRLGKTSLWAGAIDPQFALVISNDSGCGGAALSRRAIGETVGRINHSFPHWFCDNFNQYNENESALPVDQHELIALTAPRPIYVASAKDDQWADPHGEFLSCLHADPVYRLLGVDGLPVQEMPAVDKRMSTGHINYHIRTGKHDVTDFDWQAYLAFADRHLMHQ